MPELINRNDFMQVVNTARFFLRHYARGVYPVTIPGLQSLPVNRMFFPLSNPGGECCFIREERELHVLTPGRFYFIPAYHPVQVRLDQQLRFLSIQTNLEIFPGTELFSGCTRMLNLPRPPEFEELLRLFDSPPESMPFAALKFGGMVQALNVSLIERYPEEDFLKPLALQQYAVLIDHLQRHGNAETKVPELAQLMNESRESFTRHFSRQTGLTPKQLIDRFLIAQSLDLLSTRNSIKEIAAQLRFHNEFLFSRYFKKHMGLSPLNWRKQYLTQPE